MPEPNTSSTGFHFGNNMPPRPRFPATRPELPPVSDWEPHLREAYTANWFTNFGPLATRLEEELKSKWGFASTSCVLAANGTAALAAPLIAANIKGRVLLPAFTFPATLSAIKMAGARPYVVDVDVDTWTIDARKLESAMAASQAEAVILVSPFGLKCDFDLQIDIARSRDLTVIVDSAAGLGVARENIEGRNVAEVYSMHATKPFGVGEGGVVFCNDSQAERIRSALNFGFAKTDASRAPWGINGKMSEFHAAIGLAVLHSFDERLSARRRLAEQYADALFDCGFKTIPACRDSTWQMFPMLAPSADAARTMMAFARERGMECRPYYSPSLSTFDGVGDETCPTSEDLAQRMVCAPLYSSASRAELDEMIDILRHSAQAAISAARVGS